jgi:AcrR family transcriptional regulator
MTPAGRRRPYAPRLPREQRREQLLDAAMTVIAEQGYGGVNIEAIARQAGVTRPVVYNLFDDLAELLGALLERQERRVLGQLPAALGAELGGDADPDRAIVDGVRTFLDAVAGDPDTWRPILLPPEGAPRVVRERVARDRMRVLAQLQTLADRALARRGTPPGIDDPELLARTMLIAAEEAGRLVLSDPARFTPARLSGFAAGVLAALAEAAGPG